MIIYFYKTLYCSEALSIMSSSELKLKKKKKLAHVVARLERAVAKCKHLLTKIQILIKEDDGQTSEDHSSSTVLVEQLSSSTELVERLTEIEDSTPNNSPNLKTALPDSIIAEFEQSFTDILSTSNNGKLAIKTEENIQQSNAPKKRKINPVENVAAYKKASAEMLCVNSHVLYAPPLVNVPPVHHRDPRLYLKSKSKKCNFTDTPMRLPVPEYGSRQVPTQLRRNRFKLEVQNGSTSNKQVEITTKPTEATCIPMLNSPDNIEESYIKNEVNGKPLERTAISSHIAPTYADNGPRASLQSLNNQRCAKTKSPEDEKDKNMTRNTQIKTSHLEHTIRSDQISPVRAESIPKASPHSLVKRRAPPNSPEDEKDNNITRNTHNRKPNFKHMVRTNQVSPARTENKTWATPQSSYQSQTVANQTRSPPKSPEHEKDKYMTRNTQIRILHLEDTVRSSHVSPACDVKRPRASPQSGCQSPFSDVTWSPPNSPEHEKEKNVTRNTHDRTPHLKHTVRSNHTSPKHAERPRASPRSSCQSPTLSNVTWSPPNSPEHEKEKNMTRNTHNREPHFEHTVRSNRISPTRAENRCRASPQSGCQSPTFSHETWASPESPEHEKYRQKYIRTRVSPTYRHNHTEHVYKYGRYKTPDRDHSRRYLPRPRSRCGRRVQSYCNSTAHHRPDRLPRFNYNR